MKSASNTINLQQTDPSRLARFRMLVRICLGLYFIYMGGAKMFAVEDFMSALNGYGIPSPLPLNLIAIFLPALELVCGLALLLHRAWRSAMLILLPFMVLFTGLILWRMHSIHTLENIPHCSVTFDCGCGNGIINACRKIVSNIFILIMMGITVKK